MVNRGGKKHEYQGPAIDTDARYRCRTLSAQDEKNESDYSECKSYRMRGNIPEFFAIRVNVIRLIQDLEIIQIERNKNIQGYIP